MEHSNTEIQNVIDEWIHNELDRQITKRRMIDGITLDELAYEFNFSLAGLKKRLYPAQRIVNRHLH